MSLSLYPCDAGMTGGTYRGLHKFEATAYGICCVLCGAKPKSSPTPPSGVDAIRSAVLDKGANPTYHDAKIENLRTSWPTLWKAIEQVL